MMSSAINTHTSPGYQLAVAVMPFMFSKHTASREECIAMIQKPVDRLAETAELRATTIALMKSFIEGNPVLIKGLTYCKGLNDSSFLAALGC